MAFPSITEYYLFCQRLEQMALDTPSLTEGLTELIEVMGHAEGRTYHTAQ